MKIEEFFTKIGLAACLLLLAGSIAARPAAGQKAPRQEKLLNGLKLIMLDDRNTDKVSIRVRIHSGSAFDPQGKEGVMKMLAESIFPTPESREFFTDDLAGSLEVVSNYDYIQVNATSKPSEFLRLLEAVATAVSNPPIDKETTARLKIDRLAALDKTEKDIGYVADRAVLARLFGTFPYGRPELGTKESVQKIEYADLKFAKDRFWGADNATVVISGNFDANLGYRAARRYLGAWLKSDSKVPATFRQPDEPNTEQVASVGSGTETEGHRFAFRGVSRADKDWPAAEVLSRIYKARLAGFPEARVENRAELLPGAFLVSVGTLPANSSVDAVVIKRIFSGPITDAEFTAARSETVAALAKANSDDRWLDADTYKITVEERDKAINLLTLTDVKRVNDRLLMNPIVTAVVKRGSTS